ncbi:ESX secretion-associated protein EspG [Actinophytocola sediminis]
MTSTFSIGERETEPITLSALEFDVLWEHLRLGQLPLVVKVPSPGRTFEEREQLERQAWAALESRGLGRPVDLHPDVESILTLIARPEREVDVRAHAGRNVRALAAAVGASAAVAELSDGQIVLRHASPSGLASAVLGSLVSKSAGPGQSVTLRTTDFEAAANAGGGTKEGFLHALVGHGIRHDDATALTEMIKDVSGMGNFGAAARDKLGRRRRAQRVVSFFDTDDGRYVQIRRPSQDGTMWTTISPADARKLIHYVEEMLAEILTEVAS